MAANPDRLGLRGTFNLIESTLRIIGGANATGALASGAAFHAFHGNVDAQLYIKTAGVLFLLGVIAFCVAFAGCFCSAVEADKSLRLDEGAGAEKILWPNETGTVEEIQKQARNHFIIAMLSGLFSAAFFLFGLLSAIGLALRL